MAPTLSAPGGKTISPLTSAQCGAYGKSWDYHPAIKCIPFIDSLPSEASNDTIRFYRPRNT